MCAPPPTAYHLRSIFQDNACSPWVKPCAFDHQCGQCVSHNESHDHQKSSNKPSKSNRESTFIKQHSYALSDVPDNKENGSSFSKKDVSNIPRFRKNANVKLTEPKAPSFMTRPRHTIHNCFPTNPENTDSYSNTTNFNRNSMKRKSFKFTKEDKQTSPNNENNILSPQVTIKPNIKDNTQFNVSYVTRNTTPHKEERESREYPVTSTKNNTPEILEDMSQNIGQGNLRNIDSSSTEDNTLCAIIPPNFNLEESRSSEKDILEKDDSLLKEFQNNLGETTTSSDETIDEICRVEELVSNKKKLQGNFFEETTKKFKMEIENAIRVKRGTREEECQYSIPNNERPAMFQEREEFIDDEYDSYVKNITLEKLYSMEDKDLFQICKSLMRIYMDKVSMNSSGEKSVKVKKVARRSFGRLLRKKNKGMNTKNIWGEIEKIVTAAITDLKGEFKNEIYRKTEEKVDGIMSKLAEVLRNANENIDVRCEETTTKLIYKLEKIVI